MKRVAMMWRKKRAEKMQGDMNIEANKEEVEEDEEAEDKDRGHLKKEEEDEEDKVEDVKDKVEEKKEKEDKVEDEKDKVEEEEDEEDSMKEVQKKDVTAKGKRPNTTLKRFLMLVLPHFCVSFLYSNPQEFFASKLFLGAGIGGFMGVGLYYLLVDPMSLYEDQKINLLYGIAGSFAVGWGTSNYFRCTTLIIATNILGKEGRAYMAILVMASIYTGPVTNLQYNVEEILLSVGCSVELQINHTKMAWKVMTSPLKKIVKDLVGVSKDLKNNSDSIMSVFKDTEAEMESTEGYDEAKMKVVEDQEKVENHTMSTQSRFNLKTMLRCEYVIELGVEKCHDWFAKKHEECMAVIWLPVLNNLLCLPMQFTFLCNILYLGNMWCKNKLPVEGNFGQIFDKVNETVESLDKGFDSKMILIKEEQTMFVGKNISRLRITDEIMENLNKKKKVMGKAISFVKVILSCTFVYLFISAFQYANEYNANIRYDNVYVTTYFRQIDARRRKLKKRRLLPLLKGENINVVYPCKLAVQGPEVKTMIKEMLQSIPILVFLILSIIIDLILFHLFQIIRKHSHISYVFSSQHKLEIFVDGDTFLAKLLRRTVGALNTSSSMLMLSNNTLCLPNPIAMTFNDYLWSCLPMVGLLSLCIIQVYVYRLRRVVASFFFPKREKRRVLFFYNEILQKRAVYANTKRKQIMRKARLNRLLVKTLLGTVYRHCRWMRFFIRRRCIVCKSSETKTSYVCPTLDCGTVYCHQCWRDMRRYCYACMPYDDFITDAVESDHEDSGLE